ncbi:MAG: hydroxyacid dehydrogenase [Gemmatimonas sp.]|nr:hydroxyacid dehydrogenase [Gemmatimonas sp.]
MHLPRRILVATRSHDEVVAALHARRPDLECRGAAHTDVTDEDLRWADTYVGFKRPPGAATFGSVRWVHCTGAGVDSWLAPPALEAAILLTRTPESFGPAIAEWTVARIFAVQQQLAELAVAQRDHRWAPRDARRVAGTRALVVGTGDVGGAIAAALVAVGVIVTGVSRSGSAEHPAFRTMHAVDALPRLVGDADWIVLALPDTPATRGLFSQDVMARCRGAVLLNAGRGSVVEEPALPEALDRGWLRGAALDVFAVEPLPASSPLWDDPRVMISPHCSGPTTVAGAVDGFLECLADLEQGRLPRRVVDRDRGY